MTTPETTSSLERSVTPEASRRVILRLASTDSNPLAPEGIIRLDHWLQRDEADHQVCFANGTYYIDYRELSDSDDATIAHAVTKTDTALLDTDLFAEVEQAWVAAPDSLSVDRLLPESYDAMDDVTHVARAIFEGHHNQIVEASLTHVLYAAV